MMSRSTRLTVEEEPARGEAWLASMYRSHWRDLCRFVRRNFGPGPPEPEDVAQIAFLKLASSTGSVELADPGAYLRRAARNVVIDSHRHASRTAAVTGSLRVLGEGSRDFSAEDVILSKEALVRLDRVIASLTPKQRVALLLQRVDGLSNVEIAKRMGISESYVRALVDAAHEQCLSARRKEGWR